jgi:hypothetical protein
MVEVLEGEMKPPHDVKPCGGEMEMRKISKIRFCGLPVSF